MMTSNTTSTFDLIGQEGRKIFESGFYDPGFSLRLDTSQVLNNYFEMVEFFIDSDVSDISYNFEVIKGNPSMLQQF